MIQLYADQEVFVDAIRTALATNRRVLAYGPTGFGKTTCFSYMASRASERGHTIGVGVHRDELIGQVSDTLKSFNVKHGIISADSTSSLTSACMWCPCRPTRAASAMGTSRSSA